MTRQGPHQGAQKSTSTAFSFSITSAWKLPSVTSGRFPATSAPLLVACFRKYSVGVLAPQAERRHLPHRLDRDPRAHLGRALGAIAEDDRNFLHTEPCLDCT